MKLRLALEMHRKALFSQFVPIQKSSHHKLVVNKMVHFGIPVIIIFSTFLYGSLGLPYESSYSNENWFQTLDTDPYVFTHQTVPTSFWVCYSFYHNIVSCQVMLPLFSFLQFHFDIGTLLTVTSSTITFLYVAFRSNISETFQVVQINKFKFTLGSQVLESRICQQISQCHKWTVILTCSCIVPLYILAMTFYMLNVYLHNVYTVTFGSFIFWFLLHPAYIFYMTYCK